MAGYLLRSLHDLYLLHRNPKLQSTRNEDPSELEPKDIYEMPRLVQKVLKTEC